MSGEPLHVSDAVRQARSDARRVPMTPQEKLAKALATRCAEYGLTPLQYHSMLLSQRGACKVCGRVFRRTPNIDHDHATGRVRGLLCFICNKLVLWRGVGAIILRRAADYLDSTFDGRAL